MTIIYFMKHSEALKYNNVSNNDSLQLQNEKWILTNNGEEIAKEKSKLDELQNFDIVFSSNYVRAIGTAKYFTTDKINIDERFGERKFGIKNWDELPNDFEEKQFNDFNYKIGNGESINEVIKREEEALNDILNNYTDTVQYYYYIKCWLQDNDQSGSINFNGINIDLNETKTFEVTKIEEVKEFAISENVIAEVCYRQQVLEFEGE